MSIFEAIILGIVQGLTEFIPVSSSGHLLIMHEIFGSTDNSLAFDVALHVGTLAALVKFFWDDIKNLAENLNSDNKQGRLARLLLIATIPAVVAGLLFGGYIDDNLRTMTTVVITLAGVGVVMLIAEKYAVNKKSDKEVSTEKGVKIGLAQAAALIPGVSRSGATITAGMFMGLDREKAARFSFLLAIPIIAGSALGTFILDSGGSSIGTLPIIFGTLAAYISGVFAIDFMLKVIGKSGLKPFAYYRIGLAVVVILFLLV